MTNKRYAVIEKAQSFDYMIVTGLTLSEVGLWIQDHLNERWPQVTGLFVNVHSGSVAVKQSLISGSSALVYQVYPGNYLVWKDGHLEICDTAVDFLEKYQIIEK